MRLLLMKGNNCIFTISMLFYYIISKELKLISTKVTYTTKQYMIEMRIGNPPITIESIINQEKDYCWFSSKTYKSENSISSNFIRNTEDGKLYDDTFTFNNNTITLYHFYYRSIDCINISNPMISNKDGYGFAFKFHDKRLSLIHHLKDSGKINHLSYSFTYQGKYSHDLYMYFGGIPDNVTQIKKGASCKVNPDQSRWACNLHKVFIGDYEYVNKHEAYFQVASSISYAPLDFLKFVSEIALKKQIQRNECNFYFDQIIYCIDKVILQFPLIQFQFDNHIISFNGTDMFYYEESNFAHLLIHHNPSNDDKWVIGYNFLKYFDLLFDYETKEVTLFSNKQIKDISPMFFNSKLSLWLFLIITCAILFFGIIMLIIQRILFK